jgi:hypothetical protein
MTTLRISDGNNSPDHGLPGLVELNDVDSSPVRPKEWTKGPEYEARVASCLTDFLDRNRPAVRALFPGAPRVVTSLNKAAGKSGTYISPCDATRKLNWYSRVGLAIDRAMVHLLGGDLLQKPRAAFGSARSSYWKWLSIALEVQFERCEERAIDVQDRAAMGLLLVVGALEPIMRGVVSPSDIDIASLPRKKCSADEISNWFSTQAPSEVAEEIAQILISSVRALPPGPYFINPVYGGFGAIMSSDADFIAGTTLVEMKCISGGISGLHIAQLLGYGAIRALAKKSETRRMGPPLKRFAILLPRRAWCVTGTLADWLYHLEGPAAGVFPQSFASYCKDLPT